MKVVIIDDEQPAIDVLEILLKDFQEINVIGTYTDTKKAYTEMKNMQIDVVFLDMEMNDMHGLEFAEKLTILFPKIEIIFVTAYSQYALQAFEVDAIDYLLKPASHHRLEKAIAKAQKQLELSEINQVLPDNPPLEFKVQAMGSFHLLDSNNQEVKWRTRKVKELFIYLWQHEERAPHRSRILEELWSETTYDKATVLMHTTVYQLRKKLKEIGLTDPISLHNERYHLNVPMKSDIVEMKQLLNEKVVTNNALKKLIDLYQGDYLEEENYPWAQLTLEQTKRDVLDYFENYLLQTLNNQNQTYYIEICLDKMLQLEPYNEKYIYSLLDYYGKLGNFHKMITLFQEFKSWCIEELGIDVPQTITDKYLQYIK